MGQHEIMLYLYKERISGNEDYFTVSEISKAMKECADNRSVRKQIKKLWAYDYLEVQTEQKWGFFSNGEVWKRRFRLREKYFSTAKKLLKENNPYISSDMSEEKKVIEKQVKRSPLYT